MMIKKIKKILLNRETVLYAVFGIGTSILNVVLFSVLLKIGLEYKISNILTLVVVKLTAYICNKNFVFQSHCNSFFGLFKEFIRFLIARGATMILEYYMLILLVEALDYNKVISKIITTVFVIILNYVIGKKAVFIKNKNDSRQK